MIWTEYLLADRQRALEERPRRREVALVAQQEGQTCNTDAGVVVLGTREVSRSLKARSHIDRA